MSRFLTYDVETLLHLYRDETPALGQPPYTELAYFRDQPPDLKLDMKEAPFRLASHPPDSLADLQDSAYRAFIQENRLDEFDSEVVRLEHYDARERRLAIPHCRYSDGLRSNYALGWHGKLRSLLAQDYGSALPPL